MLMDASSDEDEHTDSKLLIVKKAERLESVANFKKHCDVKIFVGGETFRAHRVILASSSTVFESVILKLLIF